jgi:hypothetical protein
MTSTTTITKIKLSKQMKKLVAQLKGNTTEFVKRGYSLQQTILKISKQGEKDGLNKSEIREIINNTIGDVVSSRHLRRLLPLELKFEEFANTSTSTGGHLSAYASAPYEYTKEDLQKFEEFDENKIEHNCSDCGKTIKLKMLELYRQYDEHDKYIGNLYLCPECYTIREKQDWEIERVKGRKKAEVTNPLIGYSYKIKGEKPDYEKSYEEKEDERKEVDKLMKEYEKKTISDPIDDELELKSLTTVRGREMDYRKTRNMLQNISGNKQINKAWKEMGISKTQYIKELRRKMKLHKEENKQREIDSNLEMHGNPLRQLENMLDDIHIQCECEAKQIRQGIYCDICRSIIIPTIDFMFKTAKEAAERRRT